MKHHTRYDELGEEFLRDRAAPGARAPLVRRDLLQQDITLVASSRPTHPCIEFTIERLWILVRICGGPHAGTVGSLLGNTK